MVFRLYLPLYSLLKQTNQMEDWQNEIKELMFDEKAAACVRNLMRDVPMRDTNGKVTSAKQSQNYS